MLQAFKGFVEFVNNLNCLGGIIYRQLWRIESISMLVNFFTLNIYKEAL